MTSSVDFYNSSLRACTVLQQSKDCVYFFFCAGIDPKAVYSLAKNDCEMNKWLKDWQVPCNLFTSEKNLYPMISSALVLQQHHHQVHKCYK